MGPPLSQRTSALDAKIVKSIDAGEAILGLHFLGRSAFFVLGAEALIGVSPDEGERRIAVHADAILCSAADGGRIVTGGDDGAVVATDANGAVCKIAEDGKRRWIDRAAAYKDGIAWSAGRQVSFIGADRAIQSIDLDAAASGLAIDAVTGTVVVVYNDGVMLWQPRWPQPVRQTQLKGSYATAALSPNGLMLATIGYEPFVYLCRLSDMAHMRLTGYGERVGSLHWSSDGQWLASSGSERLLLWPSPASDGLMYSVPILLAPHVARVTAVRCHPADAVVAVGYADGLVLLVRIPDGAEIILNRPDSDLISAISWSQNGELLAFASERGKGKIVQLG